MTNVKQSLLNETRNAITVKEREIKESAEELELLSARLNVEKKILTMQDVNDSLKDDFKYSAQALESMLAQEQNRNIELNKELEMLKYRKAVIENQFSDSELEH